MSRDYATLGPSELQPALNKKIIIGQSSDTILLFLICSVLSFWLTVVPFLAEFLCLSYSLPLFRSELNTYDFIRFFSVLIFRCISYMLLITHISILFILFLNFTIILFLLRIRSTTFSYLNPPLLLLFLLNFL